MDQRKHHPVWHFYFTGLTWLWVILKDISRACIVLYMVDTEESFNHIQYYVLKITISKNVQKSFILSGKDKHLFHMDLCTTGVNKKKEILCTVQ
jgi:hypothetical protein